MPAEVQLMCGETLEWQTWKWSNFETDHSKTEAALPSDSRKKVVSNTGYRYSGYFTDFFQSFQVKGYHGCLLKNDVALGRLRETHPWSHFVTQNIEVAPRNNIMIAKKLSAQTLALSIYGRWFPNFAGSLYGGSSGHVKIFIQFASKLKQWRLVTTKRSMRWSEAWRCEQDQSLCHYLPYLCSLIFDGSYYLAKTLSMKIHT